VIKVKAYLDKHFRWDEPSTAELKEDGHYEVFGHWGYPFDYDNTYHPDKIYAYIGCICNNETLQIRSGMNGKIIGWYGYLQTYKHIKRGEPDIHGYYARSTDEEVIKYLKYLKEKYFDSYSNI